MRELAAEFAVMIIAHDKWNLSMSEEKTGVRSWVILLVLMLLSTNVLASEKDNIKGLLDEFLAGVDSAAVHDRFWADDLIYTSSSGTRTNKSEIMSGFDKSSDDDSDEPGPAYSAEDVQINVYGTTALVAFRLVAEAPDASQSHYLNTGTFLKRNGMWRVVAWQATKIPDQ